MAEVVAMAEPEMAAKIIQARVVTMARPPVIQPKSVSQKSTVRTFFRLVAPISVIRFPASMKKGMAIRGKESTPVMAFCVMSARGMLVKHTRVTRVEMPMA